MLQGGQINELLELFRLLCRRRRFLHELLLKVTISLIFFEGLRLGVHIGALLRLLFDSVNLLLDGQGLVKEYLFLWFFLLHQLRLLQMTLAFNFCARLVLNLLQVFDDALALFFLLHLLLVLALQFSDSQLETQV